ncbi:t-cell immunomodulatory protein [Limosa lapponica baueri]|uniref:T-cell immunomodulatory protein n=1 Tax=Limosa lapponica baueri TaxID=1758121 RepID=A0A2I0T2A8_LIMLA|nr:t-cell immunomodulatory protein [Limosa lapponica baueri]
MAGGRRGLCLCLLLAALLAPGRALQNVTAQLFGAEAYGTLAAFGDFNSDKQTDLFGSPSHGTIELFSDARYHDLLVHQCWGLRGCRGATMAKNIIPGRD